MVNDNDAKNLSARRGNVANSDIAWGEARGTGKQPRRAELGKRGVLMTRDLSYRDGSGKEREEQKLGEILEVEES